MTQPSNEQWRDVVGHEGYRVSANGRVLGKSGKILSPVDNGHGYMSVPISGAPRRYVHQLVLEAFVGPRPDGYQARHLNGNRGDNRASNLAWGTPSENARDKLAHGTDHYGSRTHCASGHELTPENTRMRLRKRTADNADHVKERVCLLCEKDRGARRLAERRSKREAKPIRSTCRRGHDILGDNGYLREKSFTRKDGSVGVTETVICRECTKIHNRKSEAKRRAATRK